MGGGGISGLFFVNRPLCKKSEVFIICSCIVILDILLENYRTTQQGVVKIPNNGVICQKKLEKLTIQV